MKRVLIMILIFATVISAIAMPCHADSSALSLSARSAVLVSAEDGEILMHKNAHRRMPMASTTKLLTALVAIDMLDLSEKVRIPREATGIEGSSVYLVEGEELTVRELLLALMLSSANDAAVALAITAGGSVEKFVMRMNEYAQGLGLTRTHLTNPHGLHDKEHYTTAYELALIAKAALENEELRKISSTYKASISYNGKKNGRTLVNHNKMLKLYRGAVGMKTGFTKDAGRCLVSAAERDGLTLIAVTLNASDDWNDHIKMLDFGFENYTLEVFAEVGEFTYSMPVVGGKESFVTLVNDRRIAFVIPKDHAEPTFVIESVSRFEYAPVLKDNAVAELTVFCGEKSAHSSLIALNDVDKKSRSHKKD